MAMLKGHVDHEVLVSCLINLSFVENAYTSVNDRVLGL
jgi:hypothetical protein